MRLARVLLFSMLAVVVGVGSTALGQVVPTSQWTPFAGTQCTINGLPMPTGSIVQAFDQSAVLCGQTITASPGIYVATSVYGDDTYSDGVDEGCVMNESVIFRVNGIIANKLGPDDDLWEGFQPLKIMNLATLQTFMVDVAGPDEGQGEAGTSVQYTVNVQNTGDGIDWIQVVLSNDLGWTVTHDQPTLSFYLAAGEIKQIVATLHIPGGTAEGTENELTATAASLFSPTTSDAKTIITTVTTVSDVDESDYVIPGQFSLAQNYPNPFNPETKITFALDRGADVNLEVFDILGRKITNLHSGYLGVGQYEFTWRGIDQSGRQAASGIYFYRLSTSQFNLTRKMTLIK